MDANGTRFHLLLGRDDWATCLVDQKPLKTLWGPSPPDDDSVGVKWDGKRNELTLQSRQFLFTTAPKDVAPSLTKRRGAGRDRYGNWYWISESGQEILVNSSGSRATTHFWSTDDVVGSEPSGRLGAFQDKQAKTPLQSLQFTGLVVTEDHFLVAGVLKPAGLLIFDLHAGGWPRQVLWPKEISFIPFDMAPRPGGGVWILDQVNTRYWALDRHLNVEPKGQAETTLQGEQQDDFQPKDGDATRRTEARTFPSGITLDAASPLAAAEPIAIEALPDGTVLVLDNGTDAKCSVVYRYRFAEQVGDPVSTEVLRKTVEEAREGTFVLRAHDMAFVPEHDDPNGNGSVGDRLYLVAQDGNQSFAFDVSLARDQLVMTPTPGYFPMRLFGSKGLITAGSVPYYDFSNGWIPLIEQPRPRYVSDAIVLTPIGEPSGSPISDRAHAFDGREPDCVWHRLMLDACIPPESAVEVWSRAANDQERLALAPWQAEPRLLIRKNGSELPFLRGRSPANKGGTAAAIHADGTWELLFQQAKGRYLQLRLRLKGNEQVTPRLRALRAYYPRFSYLERYLPAVYREDAQSASFLDRFLANLEGCYTTIEDKIAAVQTLFDSRSAPNEALEWLGSWFDAVLDPTWDDAKRRLFIRHAVDFYQYRGTIHGLKMVLHLAFDSCADETIFHLPNQAVARREGFRVVEKYLTRRTPAIVFGDPTDTTTFIAQASAGNSLVTQTARWQPDQRGETLHQRYREALQLTGTSARFPIQDPGGDLSVRWQQFSRAVLGFVPSATSNDTSDWHDFLARRYGTISVFNHAYTLSGSNQRSAFSEVKVPESLPHDGGALRDWFQFEGVVLPIRRTAHRFTVLLPTPLEDPDGTEHRRRLEWTKRLVELEKPAHTTFDVKFYWALFRVGEARLGEDTVIDLGSRAPQLMPPMILGQQHLSESYLAPGHPQNVTDRQVVGRDRLVNNPSPLQGG
jgi:phage tail-like protein